MECKIQNFKDLNAWKDAHQLVLSVYRATRHFPEDEKFALVNQIRRCAVSITSNIAEGFGRNSSKDKVQFYAIARGSLLELESQLLISKDLGYVKEVDFAKIDMSLIIVGKMLGGLIKTAPTRH